MVEIFINHSYIVDTYITQMADANTTDVNPFSMSRIYFSGGNLLLELSNNFTYGRKVDIILSDNPSCNYPGPSWIKLLSLPTSGEEGTDVFKYVIPLNKANTTGKM